MDERTTTTHRSVSMRTSGPLRAPAWARPAHPAITRPVGRVS